MNKHNNNIENSLLFTTVISGNYCIGCGACASIKNSPVRMEFDKLGKYIPYAFLPISTKSDEKLLSVCPFSSKSTNEDSISSDLFKDTCEHDENFGYYSGLYAGYTSNNTLRSNGSSGGLGTWILSTLLQKKMIDSVIHVKQNIPTKKEPQLFKYMLSNNYNQIESGAKSKYYPIELSQIITLIRGSNLRYAISGVPCFIKAVRLLCKSDTELASMVKYTLGLVCGHLKTSKFADMYAWQLGISPGDLFKINFRHKLANHSAMDYGVQCTTIVNGIPKTLSSPIRQLYGHQWGLGLFKINACDYCDDVFCETADITIGDAWVPKYQNDSQGTNIVIVRNSEIQKLIDTSIKDDSLNLESVSTNLIIESQAGGLRHRHSGLAYRLYLLEKKGIWYPPKRIFPSNKGITRKYKKTIKYRLKLSQMSHMTFSKAINKNDFSLFINKMSPVIKKYQHSYTSTIDIISTQLSFLTGLLTPKIKKQIRSILNNFGIN